MPDVAIFALSKTSSQLNTKQKQIDAKELPTYQRQTVWMQQTTPIKTGWWFQIFYISTLTGGNDSQFDQYFFKWVETTN